MAPDRLRHRLSLALLAALLVLSALARAEPSATAPERDLEREEKDALAVISARRAREHVLFLAGPKCEGRASGEEGADTAADYLAKVLEEMGAEPAGEGGTWFQSFTVQAGPFPGQGRRTGREVTSAPTRNVIGVVRGGDPERSREAIVLGAHYDHLGYRDLRKGKDEIADDLAKKSSGRKVALLLLRDGRPQTVAIRIP
jgi:hypothetical protein